MGDKLTVSCFPFFPPCLRSTAVAFALLSSKLSHTQKKEGKTAALGQGGKKRHLLSNLAFSTILHAF